MTHVAASTVRWIALVVTTALSGVLACGDDDGARRAGEAGGAGAPAGEGGVGNEGGTGSESAGEGMVAGATAEAGAPGAAGAAPADADLHAGALSSVAAERADFDARNPVEPNNPNVLFSAPGSIEAEELDDLSEGITRVAPLNLELSPTLSTARVPWNSAAGGLKAGEHVQTEYNSNWPFPAGRENCVPPVVRISCCSRELTEGVDSSGDTVTYYSPNDLWVNTASADVALKEIYAQVPLYLPFTNPDVRLSHGWIYDGEDKNAHGGHDYNKATDEGEDPSFRVRAVGAGTVVAKYWDAWSGNVVVIEHPGIGDFVYRSIYVHLRDGKAHDVVMALTRTPASGDEESSRSKYLKFAGLDNPSDLWWGTDEQEILVDVGDTVRAHEHIAWSGNTGPGGAGKGLNTDGTPKNEITANNHLHFTVTVRHPLWTADEWVYVDPAGVYEQRSTGCYDLLVNTQYDRLLAPFYPYFHGVDLGVFNHYLYYYGQMGRSPSTLSVQRTEDDVVASGAFKSGLSSAWYVFDYMRADPWQEKWDELVEGNFRLVDRMVTLDGDGVPRYSGVFRPDTSGDFSTFGGQTLADYQDSFDELTEGGYDLVDFFGYHSGDTDLVASIYAPQPGDFIHHALLTSAEFKDLTNELADDGWLPVDVNVMEMADGTYLSALYRQTNDLRMVHWGMSASEYQQWMSFYLAKGWDLEIVQSYAEGERFAAIWAD